jgi:thiamine kinase-like enzyme
LRKIALWSFWLLAVLVYQTTRIIVFLDRKFNFKLSFPKSIDQFKQQRDWSLRILRECGALPGDADVLDYSIEQTNPDLIFRSDAAKCVINYTWQGRESDFTFVAKFSPTTGSIKSRVVYNLQQNTVKEVQFYRELAGSLKSGLVPQVYFAQRNDLTSNMCILMEYMDNHKEYDEFEGCPEHLVPVVVKKLAETHSTFWHIENEEVKGIMSIPRVVADFFESHCRWNKWSKEALAVFRKSWETVNTDQTVIHGDPRVGNILFNRENKDELILIDWQGTRMSKAAFDLAYFIILSTKIDLRLKCEDEMLVLYHESLMRAGISDYSFDSFVDDYNHSVIMTLTMLATPWLTFEGNFTSANDSAMIFVLGYQYWYDRMESKMADLDMWLADRFGLDISKSQEVLAEILSHFKSQIDSLRDSICPDRGEAERKFAEIEERIRNI